MIGHHYIHREHGQIHLWTRILCTHLHENASWILLPWEQPCCPVRTVWRLPHHDSTHDAIDAWAADLVPLAVETLDSTWHLELVDAGRYILSIPSKVAPVSNGCCRLRSKLQCFLPGGDKLDTAAKCFFSTEAFPKSGVRMSVDHRAKITNPPAELSAFYTENEPAPGWPWLDLTIRHRQLDGFYFPGIILKRTLLGLFYLVRLASNSQLSTLPSINITWVAPRKMYHELLLFGCHLSLMVPIHRFHNIGIRMMKPAILL